MTRKRPENVFDIDIIYIKHIIAKVPVFQVIKAINLLLIRIEIFYAFFSKPVIC